MLERKQWIGIIVLTALIAALVVFVHLVPQRELPPLDESDTLATTTYPHRDSTRTWRKRYRKHESVAIRRYRFNPNTADSITLLEQGLKPWQAGNLLKYRRAGGHFRKRDDLRRLYGLTDEQYEQMRPYIDLPTALPADSDTTRRDTFPRYVSIKRDTILELNTADTAELQMLRGIGRWTAVQIVRYREQLGGYYSIDQLREIPNIDQAMLDTVAARFTVDTTLIERIMVNRCSVGALNRHPYLRFEQAKAIYEHRRKHIRLSSMQDLQDLPQMSADCLDHISHYLSFE